MPICQMLTIYYRTVKSDAFFECKFDEKKMYVYRLFSILLAAVKKKTSHTRKLYYRLHL